MEHLPAPESTPPSTEKYWYIGVSYTTDCCVHASENSSGSQLCQTCQKENQGWYRFPQRMGWRVTEDQKFVPDAVDGPERRDIAAVLQGWLYEGVLKRVLFEAADMNSLLRVDLSSGEKYLDTGKLNEHLLHAHELMSANLHMSAEDLDDYKVNLIKELVDLNAFHLAHNATVPYPLSEPVKHSIVALWEGLNLHLSDRDLSDPFRLQKYELSEVSRSKLLRLNWCPQEISRLNHFAEAHYASLLGSRIRPHRHGSCTENVCVADSIDESQYATKHVTDDCRCEMRQVDSQRIIDISEHGQFPVIFWDRDRQQLQVEGIDKIEKGRYLAISHVWADGLGNPHRNALPTCQVDKIQMWATALCHELDQSNYTFPYWFMDTLCIPVKDKARTDVMDARKELIANMSGIYGNAALVLVRDGELSEYSVQNGHAFEAVFRIRRSMWTQRLWTLSESKAAVDLFFVFADCIRRYSELLIKVETDDLHTRALIHSVKYRLGAALRTSYDPDLREGWAKNIRWAFTSASGRRTSHKVDELLCIAAIAGLPAEDRKQLVCDSISEQVQRFVTLVGAIPISTLLYDVPRLDTPGFRWCPRDIAKHYDDATGLEQDFVSVTLSGVMGQWRSVRFELSPKAKSEQPVEHVLVKKRQGLGLWFILEREKTFSKRLMASSQEGELWAKQYAFLYLFGKEFLEMFDSVWIPALLVELLTTKEDIRYVHLLENAYLLLPKRGAHYFYGHSEHADAELLEESRSSTWCID